MSNRQVAHILREVAELLELEDVPFKPRAYRRAAQTVESSPTDMEELVREGRLGELPGVGKAISEKIEEIVRTGRLSYHEELRKKLPVDLYTLTQVEGVGVRTVKRLYEGLGVRNLTDLERAAREGKIRALPGMGEKSEARILRGLAEVRGTEARILLWYALNTARALCRKLEATGLFARLAYAGSLRRGRATVGDLDLLGISHHPEQAAQAFVELPEVGQVLARGAKRASVRLSEGLQVDLRLVPEGSFGAALQYFTGSKEHNVRLRERAVGRGHKLNEYGLFDEAGEALAGADEQGIYRSLGLEFIPPELREDQGEVQAAERGELPKLVSLGELLGDLHIHTNWSDGDASVERMAQAARERGFRYIAITDHFLFSESVGGVTAEDLRRQLDEVARLNEELEGFRILSGVEANILPDGSLDVPRDILMRLDLVIGSIHSRFRTAKKEMTERLLRAVDEEAMDVLGHPTGRLIGERAAYEVDWDEVFSRAAKTGTALEINANPQRLDLNSSLVRRAVEAGARLIIGTDAHAVQHLDFLELGVVTARRGWVEAKHVLNTLSAEKVLAARKRGCS
ncbi:MAG: DNA polymerase/3'-5' exonuclease PolX [Candidatus Bipolaricaulota bacterium]